MHPWKKKRRETKVGKGSGMLWKGNSGGNLEMTALKALKSWLSHDLPWPSHETFFFLKMHIISPGQLWHPGETKHVERPQRAASCTSGGLHQHSNHHPQVNPGSIAGVHRKASEHGIWDCDLVSKKAPNKKINLDGSKCWMSHFVHRQFNFPSFHFLWSADGRLLPLLYHPSGIGHSFPPLSSWFSWAANRTLFALSISARREAQWSKPRQAWGEARRRGERTSGGTEKEGGGGRTKGKDEGCSLVLLCPTFSGGFQSSRGWRKREAETAVRKIQNGRKEKRDTTGKGELAEWSQLCRMRF